MPKSFRVPISRDEKPIMTEMSFTDSLFFKIDRLESQIRDITSILMHLQETVLQHERILNADKEITNE